ncbi:MAG: T9SS type A sorting domain-containing protein, partial [Sphingobacteriales bacterium]
GNTHGYNLSASAQAGHDPKTIDGFNVEGMVFGPDGTTLYIGFRAPLVPTGNRTKALIAPILNFETWFNNGAPAGNPTIGNPIELALGTRGIRDMIKMNNGTYVIVAGSYNDNSIPAIYRWSGHATDAPLQISSFNLTGMNAEAVLPVTENGAEAFDKLQIICDNGDIVFYNDGIVGKDLANDAHKKFVQFISQSAEGSVLPVRFISFNGHRSADNIELSWTYSSSAAVTQWQVQRSANAIHFTGIATLPAHQTHYTDTSAALGRSYYRIVAKDITGAAFESFVKTVDAENNTTVSIYPNPVVNDLYISTLAAGIKMLRIVNSNGRQLPPLSFSNSLLKISTAGWSRGIYFISVSNSKGETIAQQKILVP